MIRENNNNLSEVCKEIKPSQLMVPDTNYSYGYILKETQYAVLKRDEGGMT